jgi:hypothetical protein
MKKILSTLILACVVCGGCAGPAPNRPARAEPDLTWGEQQRNIRSSSAEEFDSLFGFYSRFKDSPDLQKLLVEEAGRRGVLSDLDLRRIRRRAIGIGMSEKAMIVLLGEPADVNATTTAAGIWKQHVYGENAIGALKYVYTENGRVAAWQD